MNYRKIGTLIGLLLLAMILIPIIPRIVMYGIAGWQIGNWCTSIAQKISEEEE